MKIVQTWISNETNLSLEKRWKIIASNTIKIIKSDDWEFVGYEGYKIDGHRLYVEDFEKLLRYLGYDIDVQEVSDEEMEEMY